MNCHDLKRRTVLSLFVLLKVIYILFQMFDILAFTKVRCQLEEKSHVILWIKRTTYSSEDLSSFVFIPALTVSSRHTSYFYSFRDILPLFIWVIGFLHGLFDPDICQGGKVPEEETFSFYKMLLLLQKY